MSACVITRLLRTVLAMPKTNGRLIKELCDEHDYTTEQLGRLVKLSGGHVRHIVRGSRVPSGRVLHRIARALHVSYANLLADEERESA